MLKLGLVTSKWLPPSSSLGQGTALRLTGLSHKGPRDRCVQLCRP